MTRNTVYYYMYIYRQRETYILLLLRQKDRRASYFYHLFNKSHLNDLFRKESF